MFYVLRIFFKVLSLVLGSVLKPDTTRKQRHTEGKNRWYVVGITLFRRHTDEKSPQK